MDSFKIPVSTIEDTKSSTKRALKRFFDEGDRNTLFVLYYTGHGMKTSDGLYLPPGSVDGVDDK